MGLDIADDYSKANSEIDSAKNYLDTKRQYANAVKRAGNAEEESTNNTQSSLDDSKKNADEFKKKIKKQVKNQFERLLEMLVKLKSDSNDKVSDAKDKLKSKADEYKKSVESDSNTARYIKRTLLKVLSKIEPQILEILQKEVINVLGCDQEQNFTPTTDDISAIYIKVKSIDLSNLLKLDPKSDEGLALYENRGVQIQTPPFSMNRELYHRIQTPSSSYLTEYGQSYVGASGQQLFDIQYFESNPITGESGGWYKITLYNRANNLNNVVQFVVDYYKTINVVDFKNIIAQIMEQLCGIISISGNLGVNFVTDATKFERIMMRILGLCFDQASEIDVSGVSKIPEIPIDDSFFEFDELDLRLIEQKVSNIKNGVVEFEDCGDLKIPVDTQAILNAINQLNFVEDKDLIKASESVSDALSQSPVFDGVAINAKLAIDFNFIKLIIQGLVVSLLSPKVLLPIFIMLKALKQEGTDLITCFMDFIKQFKTFIVNIISKIGGIFIRELFALIKKDIKNLLQQIILDVAKEQGDKRIIVILKLIQLLIVIAQAISDWRRCKSVIDEILWLLKIATTGWNIPLPLLFASQLLDGYSESRAFMGVLGELQKIGVPVGPMPDGSPNLEVLSKFAQMKAMAAEDAQNNKVQIAVGPLSITPAGLTIPASAWGKKI